MRSGPSSFAGRFIRVRELSRSPHCVLSIVFDDETGRELTLRQLIIPGLSQRYQLSQKLRESVARAQQVSHPCLAVPVACGVDRPTESLWITYDVVLRRDESATGVFPTLGFADKVATLAELGDALVVAGASSSVHGTLHPQTLHIEKDAPRGLYLLDLDVGPFMREAAIATGVKHPPHADYAAPEILRAPTATGTRASDVYSVAAMAREAIDDARFEIAEPLSTLIEEAHAASPEKRPSMRDLALGLRAFAESLAVRGGHAERALREARRDATLVVEGAEMEAARRSGMPLAPVPRKRRERPEGLIIGLVALVLAGVLAFLSRPSDVDDGRLRVRTQAIGAEGATPSTVRLFVDDRFRGVVSPEEHREVSLSEGPHRVVLRFEDGGVAAQRSVEVSGVTDVTVRVPANKADDIPAIIRRARIDRYGDRCAGTWTGSLEPGRRPVQVVLARSIEGGVCGHVDAGVLGEGPLRDCDFDGEALLIGEVTLRGPRPLAMRFICGASPSMTFFTPTATATLTRAAVAEDAGVTDGGTR